MPQNMNFKDNVLQRRCMQHLYKCDCK